MTHKKSLLYLYVCFRNSNYKQNVMKKKRISLTGFTRSLIRELEAQQRFGTAHIYSATLNMFTAFLNRDEVYFSALTPAMLKQWENHLRTKQRKWNTISTYMRTLRAISNQAAEQRLAPYMPKLFKGVYTGVRRERKLALTAQEMNLLVYAWPRKPLPEGVQQARDYLKLMFHLQGMPFVDLAHLHRNDFDVPRHILSCHRQKTGTSLEINIPPVTARLIEQLRGPEDGVSPYLLNILSGKPQSKETYQEYQQKLRTLNTNLKLLARIQGVGARVSSYTARHTWATLAKYCRIPEGLICDALGHTSVKTTETYLKSFENRELEKANSKIISLVKGAVTW